MASWLFTQRGRGVPRTNPDSNRVEDLNHTPPRHTASQNLLELNPHMQCM